MVIFESQFLVQVNVIETRRSWVKFAILQSEYIEIKSEREKIFMQKMWKIFIFPEALSNHQKGRKENNVHILNIKQDVI